MRASASASAWPSRARQGTFEPAVVFFFALAHMWDATQLIGRGADDNVPCTHENFPYPHPAWEMLWRDVNSSNFRDMTRHTGRCQAIQLLWCQVIQTPATTRTGAFELAEFAVQIAKILFADFAVATFKTCNWCNLNDITNCSEKETPPSDIFVLFA